MSDTDPSGSNGELARLIDALGRQAEATRKVAELIESRALPLLDRIAAALERGASTPAPVAGFSAPGSSEARRAIADRRWDDAELMVRDLVRDHPADPGVAALADDLDRARMAAAVGLRDRIEAARQANDPDGVLALRDELARVEQGEPAGELDRTLAKWLMGVIHKRLRTGTVRPDVVELAGRVADRFGATTEGASLRASMPTLRRSAGLCPRCAEPYSGVADACPKCLAASAPPTNPAAPPADEIPDDPEAEIIGEPVDLNNERFWQTP